MANALLIDHEYCTGCRSCEIACRNAHEETMGAEQWGIHVHEEGPWKLTEKKWEWEYLPFPTHLCDLCSCLLYTSTFKRLHSSPHATPTASVAASGARCDVSMGALSPIGIGADACPVSPLMLVGA